MTHKGQRTARMNERDFPHVVELPAENVMLANMDRLTAWHRQRGIEDRRGRGQRRDDRDYVRYCFADAETAHAFAAVFGGLLCFANDSHRL